MKRFDLLVSVVCILVLSLGFVTAIDDLITLQGNVQEAGVDLTSGNVTVYIYDAYSGGNVIWNSSLDNNNIFNNSISSGRYDVLLGNDSSNNLSLEYGKHYYLELYINDEAFTFNGSSRQIFQSSVGQINATAINPGALNETHFKDNGLTFNRAFNMTLVTGYFKGLFDWVVNTSSSSYLIFNGSTLSFNEDQLNTTILDLESNETTRVNNLQDGDCTIGSAIGVHPNGTIACSASVDFTNVTATGNLTVSGKAIFGGGWQSGGVTIDSGKVYVQTLFAINITSLGVTNLNINGSLIPAFGFGNTFDIGNESLKWRNGFFSNNLNVSNEIHGGDIFSDGNINVTTQGHNVSVGGGDIYWNGSTLIIKVT